MIKIYTLTCLFIFTTLFAQAQFEKGQKVLGGNVTFGITKADNLYTNSSTNYATVNVNPSVGWFIKPNLLRGFSLNYGYSYQRNKSSNGTVTEKMRINSVGAGAFSQRFFALTSKLFFTLKVDAAANYNFGRNISIQNGVEQNAKSTGYGIGVGITPGLTYKLSPRWLFDASLANVLSVSYSHSKTDVTSLAGLKATQDNFSLSSSLSNTNLGGVGLGFRWLMKR